MADSVKRAYRSTNRAAAAAARRARIRQAAARLFVEHGYAATTMRQVAAAAEVGERTLYDAFPSKTALFSHTLDVSIAGDEQPVAVAARPEVTAALAEDDPRAAITRHVAYCAALLDRAGDLIMVSVEAAGTDADMRAAAEAGAAATHRVHLALAESLQARGALRPGLTATAAADLLYALLSPHLHQLLRRHRTWSSEQYCTWLEQSLTRDLLEPRPDSR
ncbi:helix-turn-helix domain-containing protein [Streptomyces sp. NPDC028635]|uniref:TetR/AcrR family transcriptional regulator n=1 Tax=Streptomyces sp. NPDC028635 TaxID=3154800 RepID=UPI0033D1829B